MPGGPKFRDDIGEDDRSACNQVLATEGRDEGEVVAVEAIRFVQFSISML